MGFFSQKSKSSLPQEILDAVRTMQDDLDGKKAAPVTVKKSSLPVSGSASPFAFTAAPAMKNKAPVNENGLTSTITITATDTSNAIPDPKASSPFMQTENEEQSTPNMGNPSPAPVSAPFVSDAPTVASPLTLDPLTPKEATLTTTPLGAFAAPAARPGASPISFSAEGESKRSSFVSENVTLGSDAPVYAAPIAVKKNRHMFMIGMILLSLAILGGGAFAYFSLMMKKPVDVPAAPVETSDGQAPVGDAPIAPTDSPFTLSSPNYLSIDVETITTEQFRSMITSKHALMESNNLNDRVIEFFVTDKNNNPVAFARFATIMGMTLPQAVMAQVDETFSLYLYNDAHTPRAALSLTLKSRDAFQLAVVKDESAIPFALQSLYFDSSVTKITAGAFKAGSYKTYVTRYFNIAPSGLSNDYTVTEKHWVIGTSEKTLHNVLDTFGGSL